MQADVRFALLPRRSMAFLTAAVALMFSCGPTHDEGRFQPSRYAGFVDPQTEARVVLALLARQAPNDGGAPVAFDAPPDLRARVFEAAPTEGLSIVPWEDLGNEAGWGIRVERIFLDNSVSGRVLWTTQSAGDEGKVIDWETHWVMVERTLTVVGFDELLEESPARAPDAG